MEYTYKTESSVSIGSMDYTPFSSGFAYRHDTKIQVSGNTLNVKFTNVQFTEYVGPRATGGDWPYADQVWEDLPEERVFSVSHNGDGVFSSMTIPSGTSLAARNIYKAWGARLQVNKAEIMAGKMAFKSREVNI